MVNIMCGVVTRSTMNNGATVLSTNLRGFRWNDIFWLLLAFFNSLSETVSLQPLHVVTDVIVFWRWQTLGQKIFWRSMFWFYYCLSPVLSLPLHAEVNNLNSSIYNGAPVFFQVLWKSEATSTFWGRTAQATSARTTMTTASTRKTVTWSINNDRKSKRGREGRVAKRGKHVDRRRERSYSFQGTLQHRKVLSLATALVGPRTVTPVNTALLRRTAWSIGL